MLSRLEKIKNNKLSKKVFATFTALAICIPAFASIAVSPTKIEINANKIKSNYTTTAIEVRGDQRSTVRFKAYAGYFEVNDKGEVIMPDATDSQYDISKKIKFVPSEFTVAPGKTQKLRVNIANLKGLADGESRAMLYIEDINPKELAVPTGNASIGAQLIVKTRMGIPIYVDKGKFSKIAVIEAFDAQQIKDNLKISAIIHSKGNSKIRYTGKVQFVQGKKLVAEKDINGNVVSSGRILTDNSQVSLKGIPSGEYTVRLVITYLDENDKRKNIKEERTIQIKSEM